MIIITIDTIIVVVARVSVAGGLGSFVRPEDERPDLVYPDALLDLSEYRVAVSPHDLCLPPHYLQKTKMGHVRDILTSTSDVGGRRA